METFIIDGKVLRDGGYRPKPERWELLGFGGAHFVIERSDGSRIHTNNLLYLGDSTEPDNARYVYCGGCGGANSCRCPETLNEPMVPLVDVPEDIDVKEIA